MMSESTSVEGSWQRRCRKMRVERDDALAAADQVRAEQRELRTTLLDTAAVLVRLADADADADLDDHAREIVDRARKLLPTACRECGGAVRPARVPRLAEAGWVRCRPCGLLFDPASGEAIYKAHYDHAGRVSTSRPSPAPSDVGGR